MIYSPYEYQQVAKQWIVEHPRCGLLLDMGLGKSVISLSAVVELLDTCECEKVLVVAPKKVAETTWTTEADKWDHLQGLRVARVLGTAKQRVKALETDADVYVISRNNFVWLLDYYNGRMPFDTLIIDELTSFKSPSSNRFKAMRAVCRQFERVVGLTGTPTPNGLVDLWAQMYCIDMGARLGKHVNRYRDKYFNQHRWNNVIVRCTPKQGSEEEIMNLISDVCLCMQAKDYLTLPPLMIHTVKVKLSDKARKAYDEFEREQVMQFNDSPVVATSAAALIGKLSQFANGAVYDVDGNVQHVHDDKIQHLVEIVEGANGASVLLFYQYKHDVERIEQALKGYTVVRYEGEQQLKDWNAGKIDVLLAHPASTAYGLNMQQGGHYIVWFGTGWDLELYQQANARLHRQGQEHPVIVYKLIAEGTVDERADMALSGKQSRQQSLLDSLNYLLTKYKQDV